MTDREQIWRDAEETPIVISRDAYLAEIRRADELEARLAKVPALVEALRDQRGYILACIGDAEGQKAVKHHRVLLLTAGQVQCLVEALHLLNAAFADWENQ